MKLIIALSLAVIGVDAFLAPNAASFGQISTSSLRAAGDAGNPFGGKSLEYTGGTDPNNANLKVRVPATLASAPDVSM